MFGDEVGGYGVSQARSGVARLPATIPDGTSNTIALGERFAVCYPQLSLPYQRIWGQDGANQSPWSTYIFISSLPYFNANPNTHCDPYGYGTFYAAGVIVSLLDGSVRTVSSGIAHKHGPTALMPNDGQVFGCRLVNAARAM